MLNTSTNPQHQQLMYFTTTTAAPPPPPPNAHHPHLHPLHHHQAPPPPPTFYQYQTHQPTTTQYILTSSPATQQVLVPMTVIQPQPQQIYVVDGNLMGIPVQQTSANVQEVIAVKEQPQPTTSYYPVQVTHHVPSENLSVKSNSVYTVPFTSGQPSQHTLTTTSSSVMDAESVAFSSSTANSSATTSCGSDGSQTISGDIVKLEDSKKSISSSSISSKKLAPKRNRSAAREDLEFLHIQEDGSNEVAKIRVWVNEKNMAFYDCSCEKRKPVQDLNKIKLHVKGHLVKQYVCQICSREFSNYRQLNGHLRVHQPNKFRIKEDSDMNAAAGIMQQLHQHIPVQSIPAAPTVAFTSTSTVLPAEYVQTQGNPIIVGPASNHTNIAFCPYSQYQ